MKLASTCPTVLVLLFACSYIDLGVPHGKCACRAPEQVDAEFGCLGTHTDVWGFATCILHLATGQLPYQDLSQIQMVSAMLKGRAPEVSSDLPDWLQHILKHALTFDPAARPCAATLHKVHTSRTLQLLEWGWFALFGPLYVARIARGVNKLVGCATPCLHAVSRLCSYVNWGAHAANIQSCD